MSSSMRLRRLAQELVKARRRVGMTVEDVTRELEWGVGRLTYIEKANGVKADVGNVIRLLDLYGVTGDEREALIDLARKSKERGWWLEYNDVYPVAPAYPGFEDAATTIRTYEPQIVPGLLQTREYAAAIYQGGEVFEPSRIARAVDARLKRQEILERDNCPTFVAVLDQAALVRMVGGPAVMEAQIRHLIERAHWPNIRLKVLPFEVGAHAAMEGGFGVLDFGLADDSPVVYIELARTSLFLEDPSDVQAYTLIFERASSAAWSADKSLAYLADLRDQLQQ